MQRASRGIHKVNVLAEKIGDTRFVEVLDRMQIGSTTMTPRLEMLKALAGELEREANQLAALERGADHAA